jgi:predicted nucleic acid-binding protein
MKYLFDTSVLLALLNEEDEQHRIAKTVFGDYPVEDWRINDHIYAELLSSLRDIDLLDEAMAILKTFDEVGLQIETIDDNILNKANRYFFKYKNMSFTAALVMAHAFAYNYHLVTFDKDLQIAYATEGGYTEEGEKNAS